MADEKPKLDNQQTVPMEVNQGLGLYSSLPFDAKGLYELNNPTPHASIDQVTEMRRKDGHGRALFQLVLLPIRYALQNGHWAAPDVNLKKAKKEVDFANQMWSLPKSAGGMSQPANKIIRQMLLSVCDGFAPFEQVIGHADKGPLKGKYILKKLSYCDPRTVKIVTDEMGGFEGFRQRTHTLDGRTRDVHVKKDYSLIFTNQDEENPYYGVSMFESAYPHYEIRKKLYYIAHLAAQFAAVPGRIGSIPQNATTRQINEFKGALANFAFNTSMVHYNNFEVKPFNGNSAFDFIKLIDHHKNMMSKSILAGFFDSENRTVLIENATMDASADMFLLTLETIAEDIAHVLSDYLMPKFIDWNFGTSIYPKFVPAKLTDASKQAVIDLFRNFAMSGTLNCTPEMVREMEKRISADFNLDIDYDEIQKREQEAAEQQAQQELESQQLAAEDNPQPQDGPPARQVPEEPAPDQTAQMSRQGSGTPSRTDSVNAASRQDEIDHLFTLAADILAGDRIDVPIDEGL